MAELSNFFFVSDGGYLTLEHYATDDTENGCHVSFVEAGDNLDELMTKAQLHSCTDAERDAP